MQTLELDIETFSSVELRDSGVHKYAESKDFQILMLAYKADDCTYIIDMVKNPILPDYLIQWLYDPKIIKIAHNAMFEITCLNNYLQNQLMIDEPLDIIQWRCSAARATTRGFPLSLESIAIVMNLQHQKDKRGYGLIQIFCKPCKPTEANGYRTRNMPHHYPAEWEQFKQYCIQDVLVEDEICKKLGSYDLTEYEQQVWFLDQKINNIGVRIDPQFAFNNIKFNVRFKEEITQEAIAISGLDKPNSVAKLKKFIEAELDLDEEIESLDKKAIEKLLKTIKVSSSSVVTQLLKFRQMSGKSSMKKYQVMLNSMCRDGRVKGMFQYYGANRTGRWAGRGVQLHNLPRGSMQDLAQAREEFKNGDYEMCSVLWPNMADTSSQLIRSAFIPSEGNTFIISDFSAIEARVVAWLANEKWRLDVFNSHGKIYEASAAQMFKVPIESVTKGSDLRTRGKIAELALGYQGSEGALARMDVDGKLPDKKERLDLVYAWRAANPNIVLLWEKLNAAAMSALKGSPVKVSGMGFTMDRGSLRIILPSGRSLYYLGARIGDGDFGPCIKYHGLDQKTKKWFPQDTYGGKLTENVTQAIARDCLADAMLRMDQQAFKIVMHVHDEIVVEVKEDSAEFQLERINKIMAQSPWWGSGTKSMPIILPLKGDGFISPYYIKES